MTSKKPAASKRANLPRASDYTKDFLKDWQRLSHSGRYDMNRLKEAMTLLIANDGPLPPEWLDHPLTGDWAGHRAYSTPIPPPIPVQTQPVNPVETRRPVQSKPCQSIHSKVGHPVHNKPATQAG